MSEQQMTYDQRVGSNVQRYRKARGWSQEHLATVLNRAGTSMRQQTIVKIENGSRAVRLSEAVSIARALDVSVEALVVDDSIASKTAQVLSYCEEVESLVNRIDAYGDALLQSQRDLKQASDAIYNGELPSVVLERVDRAMLVRPVELPDAYESLGLSHPPGDWQVDE